MNIGGVLVLDLIGMIADRMGVSRDDPEFLKALEEFLEKARSKHREKMSEDNQ